MRFFRKLPKEGSYIEYSVKYQYDTFVWKGIVGHHDCKSRFYIKTETSTLCNIKP
jgi:hypothetical protein